VVEIPPPHSENTLQKFNTMWEYKKEVVTFENPTDAEPVETMNSFGKDGWEIFSIQKNVKEESEVYWKSKVILEYTMYMKRLVESI
jgi:hypothetical protein